MTEIARLFRVASRIGDNIPAEIYPGYPAPVITDRVETMVWGFPLAQRSKRTGNPLKPRPVNNARTDKLQGRFWNASFRKRRCLIPLTAFAEAEGPAGAKTRTWFSMPDSEVFACAGIWRDSAEWGRVFSMVMTQANETVAPVHDRMPVLLSAGTRDTWLGGSTDDALSLCRPWQSELAIDRTGEPWSRKK